ncbi:MAG: hypothetical protein SPM31_06885 [Prevotella sp.]|nr:hypothetical protein [Prevotella sp.]
MKKKYVKPTSELIQVHHEGDLLNGTLKVKANNWLNNEDMKTQKPSSNWEYGAPATKGEIFVKPGDDIDIGSKVNPWASWDE